MGFNGRKEVRILLVGDRSVFSNCLYGVFQSLRRQTIKKVPIIRNVAKQLFLIRIFIKQECWKDLTHFIAGE